MSKEIHRRWGLFSISLAMCLLHILLARGAGSVYTIFWGFIALSVYKGDLDTIALYLKIALALNVTMLVGVVLFVDANSSLWITTGWERKEVLIITTGVPVAIMGGMLWYVNTVINSRSQSNTSTDSRTNVSVRNETAVSPKNTDSDQHLRYVVGFIVILICLGIFVGSLNTKPKIFPEDTPPLSSSASENLPVASKPNDSNDSGELVTQGADKQPEAKEEISDSSRNQGYANLSKGEVLVTGNGGESKSFSPEQEAWLGKADRTDPFILARMRSAVPDR